MEFHVSRKSRERYQFDQNLFSLHGNVIFANFSAARQFADKMNQKRDLIRNPEQAVKASHINAMGLMDEIIHLVIKKYREDQNIHLFWDAILKLNESIGKPGVNLTLNEFSSDFPPLRVYTGEESLAEYMEKSSEGRQHQEIVLEELLVLWLSNQNPAYTPYQELFDDRRLEDQTHYNRCIDELYEFFNAQPQFGNERINLIDFLREPALKYPDSIFKQLDYVRSNWGGILGEYLIRLLSSLDFIREEEKAVFFGAGPVEFPDFTRLSPGEFEGFSLDTEWMPRLVLIAKNIYVWLDQLSKKYQKNISRLDHIPDTELQILQNMGVTGLWLIGVWERSPASSTIKKLCGNPEALASAYSLHSYQIANDLGGKSAFDTLKDQAWKFGIRMASDMVPNHMGIDSPWIYDHPDWFISLNYSPYPAYSFTGPDLSSNPDFVIQIEDHYYNRTDAAVVFKHYDRRTGQTRFIYHGNDGTNMPWNDTAQLNYLMPEVREAVIQLIIQVARQFPIIRFDAAMTLAKRHYQRLWFPEPGSGGDIPTRAEHAITKEHFDVLLPQEFWREVVDRVAREAPDTLLLAEAFWLMEGYFVRTLGMHRVYNSAFMNLLRNEENEKFRGILKSTLEFDPEILKRFVNFMNNPDERTAVDQFGKGDKYFGICTLMATLPGLPMIGHGQIEGFTEKYGMEYRKAYWDEIPDHYLVERHLREIAPLFHHRRIFANVDHFLLYDFYSLDGKINQDVYAYSNRNGNQRALVVFHNRYGDTRGWIRQSVPFTARISPDQKDLTQKDLKDGLLISNQPNTFTSFRDQITRLEYIRANESLVRDGLYVELRAYHYHVFSDFTEILDDDQGTFRQLCDLLNNSGVPSLPEALKEFTLRPLLQPFQELFHHRTFSELIMSTSKQTNEEKEAQIEPIIGERLRSFLTSAARYLNVDGYPEALEKGIYTDLETLLSFLQGQLLNRTPGLTSQKSTAYLKTFFANTEKLHLFIAWGFLRRLGQFIDPTRIAEASGFLLQEWMLKKIVFRVFTELEQSEKAAWKMVNLLEILIHQQNWYLYEKQSTAKTILEDWLKLESIRNCLGVNRYLDVLWFNQEAFLEFLDGMYILAIFGSLQQSSEDPLELITMAYQLIQDIQKAIQASGYQVDTVLKLLE